ncbi:MULTISPECIES: YsnF/AvaK domain-containing protein [unclassified Janthinobacterium]|uniref:YsnF/AvaK domain-containing protein n=1 Tax=unclassified Janthinobacterium TaxID=2610881 RepID=UPI000475E153|nr:MULTISPECIES: YsnF/AvaK domain-containing protein [unclassified Janthinobacterium]MEC5161922.1 uncharacterized protein (TIGR02271 family) [Janthinobacterium sp. CG_S6]
MQHTLVAVFDNRADAQQAKDELLSSGFASQDVRLSEGDAASAGVDQRSGADASVDDGSIGSSIKSFFSNMFGTDTDEHAQKYSTAVSRGSYVLTVSADDEAEVERAADIVEGHGPVDIDEKSAQWRGAGMSDEAMRMGSGGQQQSVSMSQQSGQGSQGAMQGSTLSGSQQREQRASGVDSTAIPVVQEELRVGKREVQRGGVRIFQRVVETPVNETVNLREEHVSVERRPVNQPVSGADVAFEEKSFELRESAEEAVVEKSARVVEEVVIGKEVTQRQEEISDTVRRTEVEVQRLGGGERDDTYYRNHYNANLASMGGAYEDYAPAYGYGSRMAGDAQYQGRGWNDVEPRLRSDWEARNPGSTWERMKAAVRHGWEKVSS